MKEFRPDIKLQIKVNLKLTKTLECGKGFHFNQWEDRGFCKSQSEVWNYLANHSEKGKSYLQPSLFLNQRWKGNFHDWIKQFFEFNWKCIPYWPASLLVWRLTALCVSFDCKALDPNSGGLKNQENISQFSTTFHQLPKMRR